MVMSMIMKQTKRSLEVVVAANQNRFENIKLLIHGCHYCAQKEHPELYSEPITEKDN
jgi:hypothetical protein